jgi:hypothetical protein
MDIIIKIFSKKLKDRYNFMKFRYNFFLKNEKKYFSNVCSKYNPITLLVFLSVICIIIFSSMISFTFSLDLAKSEAQKNHDIFYNEISPMEKRIQFATMYNGWKWAYGKNERAKTIDCLNSFKGFYAKFGARLENASIPGLTYRLTKIKRDNPQTKIIRRKPSEVCAGDYIILDYSSYKKVKMKNGEYITVPHINRHIGMITDITPNGWVRYASVEVQTGTETLNIIRFYDRHIVYIAEMDTDLFAGNF